jgi:hypothetical protein
MDESMASRDESTASTGELRESTGASRAWSKGSMDAMRASRAVFPPMVDSKAG